MNTFTSCHTCIHYKVCRFAPERDWGFECENHFDASQTAALQSSTQFAEGFEKGQQAVMRRNESGCCCMISEDDILLEPCALHADWLKQKLGIALQSQPAPSGWISVKENLPKDNTNLLVWDGRYWYEAWYRGGLFLDEGRPLTGITYWQIPAPPEGTAP
jgi:Protein of unknown function (DUF551)